MEADIDTEQISADIESALPDADASQASVTEPNPEELDTSAEDDIHYDDDTEIDYDDSAAANNEIDELNAAEDSKTLTGEEIEEE